MKVELHINGKLCLALTPESDIERLVVEQMYDGAAKGKAVAMRCNPADHVGGCWRYAIEVER